ncbi:MAG TPA: MarR family transcriptional regulator [Gemmatimonadaceae bacterium]|nr:MarR family transcriptional regulator [Gemmatimonadaceae bacterium]
MLLPHDVSWQQYNVLRILRGAGPSGLPTLAIGDRMLERTPGVTRLVDRLVAKGLVARARGTTDQRQVLCRATADGLALLARLDAPVDAADDFMMSALDESDLVALIELSDRIRATIAAALLADR